MQVVTRNQWEELPVPDEVILRMNDIASCDDPTFKYNGVEVFPEQERGTDINKDDAILEPTISVEIANNVSNMVEK